MYPQVHEIIHHVIHPSKWNKTSQQYQDKALLIYVHRRQNYKCHYINVIINIISFLTTGVKYVFLSLFTVIIHCYVIRSYVGNMNITSVNALQRGHSISCAGFKIGNMTFHFEASDIAMRFTWRLGTMCENVSSWIHGVSFSHRCTWINYYHQEVFHIHDLLWYNKIIKINVQHTSKWSELTHYISVRWISCKMSHKQQLKV